MERETWRPRQQERDPCSSSSPEEEQAFRYQPAESAPSSPTGLPASAGGEERSAGRGDSRGREWLHRVTSLAAGVALGGGRAASGALSRGSCSGVEILQWEF